MVAYLKLQAFKNALVSKGFHYTVEVVDYLDRLVESEYISSSEVKDVEMFFWFEYLGPQYQRMMKSVILAMRSEFINASHERIEKEQEEAFKNHWG